METQLLVQIAENRWDSLDLFDEIPISVTIQETDVLQVDARKSSFSKTFTIPGTNTNNKFFKNFYSLISTDFDALQKIPCVITSKTTVLFTGYLRLNSVTINNTSYEYEVFIVSNLTDFFSQIKDFQLQELDFGDLIHERTYTNVTTSWEANGDGVSGLFGGKIVYPMINYGLRYDNPGGTGTTIPQWEFIYNSGRTITNPIYAIPTDYFKPAIQIKTVIDRIAENTTYTINSDFFDTDYFKSIYMDLFSNGFNSEQLNQTGNTNQNLFRIYSPSEQTFFHNSNDFAPPFTTSRQQEIQFNSFGTDGYDNLNNYIFFSSSSTPPINNYFRAPRTGQYFFNLMFNFAASFNFPNRIAYFQIIARKSSSTAGLVNGTIVYSTNTLFVNGIPTDFVPQNLFFNVNLNAGENIKLFLVMNAGNGPQANVVLYPYNFGGITKQAPMFELYSSPAIDPATNININQGIVNTSCVDFIKSLVTMFNLVIVADDEAKTIRMVPYNWYFGETNRIKKDWNKKLDLNSTYKISPNNFELAKIQEWSYLSGEDEYLNKMFEDKNTYVFGRTRFVSSSNILTDEQRYELMFSPLPTDGLPGAPNFIIPNTSKFNADTGTYEQYNANPHIFFWVGNRYAYSGDTKSFVQPYYIFDDSFVAQPWTTYPCVSHLSNLDILNPNFVSDLSFNSDFDFFSRNTTSSVFSTQNTLFNFFWSDLINGIYSKEFRKIQAKIWLTPQEIADVSLTDKIYIKNASYRIEKITDADLTVEKLTDVILVRDIVEYYQQTSADLPAPVYSLEPNALAPQLTGYSQDDFYVSINYDEVCDSSVTPIQLRWFGTFNFTGTIVYDTNFNVLPFGTFLRRVLTTPLCVVADYGGTIEEVLPTPCTIP